MSNRDIHKVSNKFTTLVFDIISSLNQEYLNDTTGGVRKFHCYI